VLALTPSRVGLVLQYLKDQPTPPLKSLTYWKKCGDKLVVHSWVLTVTLDDLQWDALPILLTACCD
jgi:hypothetical protein